MNHSNCSMTASSNVTDSTVHGLFSLLDRPCGLGVDLVFMVDISGSVCDYDRGFIESGVAHCSNFIALKEFIVNLMRGFDISSSKDRIALVTFNGTAKIQWPLDRFVCT